MLEPIHWHWYY